MNAIYSTCMHVVLALLYLRTYVYSMRDVALGLPCSIMPLYCSHYADYCLWYCLVLLMRFLCTDGDNKVSDVCIYGALFLGVSRPCIFQMFVV